MGMKRSRKRVYRRVSRKPKGQQCKYYDVKRNITDFCMSKKWDNTESISKNFSMFTIMDFADRLANDEELLQETPKKKLSELEVKIIHKLCSKHENDFKAMERDIKVNIYQWTAQRCKKLASVLQTKRVCTSAKNHLQHLMTSPDNKE